MFFFVNLLGLVVFLGIGVLASRNRKEIQWRSVASLLTLNLMLAWFLTSFEIGREMITAAAAGFTELINISYVGIAFVFPDWVHVPQMNFFAAALLPILFVVPLFDILTYFGILPFVIRWIGKLLTFLTRAPKFESFFSIEMMFLGNTEALAVSKLQLMKMSKERVLTIGLMSMSCVTAALIAVYVKMMPAEYVVTAIPLNVINALLVSSLLHPVKVAPEEDTIATGGASRSSPTLRSRSSAQAASCSSSVRTSSPSLHCSSASTSSSACCTHRSRLSSSSAS